ncbi:MAG: nucleotidyltransferase domain-containing protein [Verrucomicrobia bacterium]|nr:nucleotidyltransferase domain-containing protein [Verrucomicrobiota bacterium]
MRLSAADRAAIVEEVRRLDREARVRLYGSRADDAARGGDLDLLVISDQLGFRDQIRLRIGILDRIGWQQLDLVLRRTNEQDEPLAATALASGIRL